jgi:hypothetical protein
MLYCKGADNIIFERLGQKSAEMKELTTHHLNVSASCFTFDSHALSWHTCIILLLTVFINGVLSFVNCRG